jgi:di/tricarboxylate transporter
MLWAKAAIVPGLVTLFLIPWVVYKIYPPEMKNIDNKALAEEGLAKLGPMSAREKILSVIFVLAVLGWALGAYLKIDATSVAIGFVAACLLTGVITWENLLASKSAWGTFIWYGGIIGLADTLAKAKFFDAGHFQFSSQIPVCFNGSVCREYDPCFIHHCSGSQRSGITGFFSDRFFCRVWRHAYPLRRRTESDLVRYRIH